MKPLVGISSCLLGCQVRYDGNHKKDDWLLCNLAPFVEWIPLCPEMEMGLGAPREPLRLQRNSQGKIRLVTVKTRVDLTDLGQEISESLVSSLSAELDGFILKNRSPSCGWQKVKVYDVNGIPRNEGVGFFANALLHRFPLLPVVEEGHLSNRDLKEHFLIRLFAHMELRRLPARVSAVQDFHQRYKYILMAHDEATLRVLGPIAANSDRHPAEEVLKCYRPLFLRGLAQPATMKKRLNVIQHYLQDQKFFQPFPRGLRL